MWVHVQFTYLIDTCRHGIFRRNLFPREPNTGIHGAFSFISTCSFCSQFAQEPRCSMLPWPVAHFTFRSSSCVLRSTFSRSLFTFPCLFFYNVERKTGNAIDFNDSVSAKDVRGSVQPAAAEAPGARQPRRWCRCHYCRRGSPRAGRC